MSIPMIIVPTQDNNGVPMPTTLEEIETILVEFCGGFTVTKAEGVWLSPTTSKVHREPVRRYEVAGVSVGYLRHLARVVLEKMDQEAVFIYHPEIGTEFVTEPEEFEVAA